MGRFKVWDEGERRTVTAFFVAGLLVGGCSSSHVLGSLGTGGQDGMAGGAGRDGGFPIRFDAGYPGDVSNLGGRQSWTGYIENYQTTGAPADAINLTFASDPSGVVVGTVTFGTGTQLPPATDPNVAYPPGLPLPLSGTYIAVGFPYAMANGSLVGQRLRFDVRTAELWSGWCGLQVPSDSSGLCVSSGQSSSSADYKTCSHTDMTTNQTVSIDCGKLWLCTIAWVCTCSATACYPNLAIGGLSFDVTFADTTASGSIVEDIRGNLHLTKDP